jgi:hypothetical protein
MSKGTIVNMATRRKTVPEAPFSVLLYRFGHPFILYTFLSKKLARDKGA